MGKTVFENGFTGHSHLGLGASRSAQLTVGARLAIAETEITLVSPVSIFEIAQKVRIGKWPEMVPLMDDLIPSIERQKAEVAKLDPAICVRAGTMAWTHRNPFDRLLAATALHHGVPIISADSVFDGIVSRIW